MKNPLCSCSLALLLLCCSFTIRQAVMADEFVRNPNIKYGILRAASDYGQPRRGSASAPDLLFKSGLIETLKEDGADIKDYGDVNVTGPLGIQVKSKQGRELRFFHEVSKVCEEVYKKVKTICGDKRMAVTLGGDHSIAIGSIAATAEAHSGEDLGILWVDAHGDINTKESTTSGQLFGMPLSFLVKELQAVPNPAGSDNSSSSNDHTDKANDTTATAFQFIKSSIPLRRLVYIGSRDLDPWEKTLIRNMNIHAFTMSDVVQLGIENVIRMTKDILTPNNAKPFHVSFDIDALSPTEAPSTGIAVPGGLLLREAISLVEQLARTGKMVGFDMTEVNPKLGTVEEAERTVLAAKHILMAALGQRRGVN